jgi:hypothetical protein
MLYELDEELSNIGLDDLSLIAKRAEVSRWVYTNFPEETQLNLGNFRGYEAEALWELGQREQAETLYQELTETFPNFAWGYIWWGDQYWMSDWSYEYTPDYDRTESPCAAPSPWRAVRDTPADVTGPPNDGVG